MILYIAEKPSLGRAVADALPQPHQRGDGFITVGNGDVVSWCIGHLLEQAEPEAYNPAFKQWSHDHLPIVPDAWQLVEKKQTVKQLRVLRKLLKQADQVVHAGDPDREGQLLVDEVIHYLGHNPLLARRLLISDLNRGAVTKALAQLRDNRNFVPLSTSALARSRADWLFGINLTRAYTLQGRKVKYDGVLSVGRVQTPVLGLVVRRDREIERFVSKPFYEVWANLQTLPEDGSVPFRARWIPSEECSRFLDEEGRNLSKELAQNVARRVSHQPAEIRDVDRKARKQLAPLPHSLSSLQIDAAKAHHLSAQKVLDISQGLYEKHKLITYPRSDCRYLPKTHHAEAPGIVAAITQNPGVGKLIEQASLLDLSRRGRAWNDARVNAHHAIIPTARKSIGLSADEARVYALICRNYLAQFLPDHEYAETRVDVEIQGGLFQAKAREIKVPGWKVLFPVGKRRQGPGSASGTAPNPDGDEDDAPTLPTLKKGQKVNSLEAEVRERVTSPPARFTDATLLAAMTGIASFVGDAELRKVLKDTDGLGTEATRAGIIELLFRRGFLARVGKHIESTAAGRGLIEALPEALTLPDMTAQWESTLTAITEKSASYNSLMTPLVSDLTRLVTDSQQHLPVGLTGVSSPVGGRRKKRAGTRRTKNPSAGATSPRKPRKKTAPRRKKSAG